MNTLDIEESNQSIQADKFLMDSLSKTIKKIVLKGKKRGFITREEVQEAAEKDELSSEQTDEAFALIAELEINLTEGNQEETLYKEEAQDTPEEEEEEEESQAEEEAEESGNISADASRSDDPVRTYLRAMGFIELLSREGEP